MKRRGFLLGAAFAAAGAAVPIAAAEDTPLAAFVGSYHGSGIAATLGGATTAAAPRDFDIEILAEGGGFRVVWTSVEYRVLQGANNQRALSQAASFLPTDRPGVYRSAKPGDPAAGETLYWARIRGRTLSVYGVAYEPDGGYVVHVWDRTLVPEGLELSFRSDVGGRIVRTAAGKLVRQK